MVAFHLLQHLVDLGHLVGAVGAAPVHQEAVGLVKQQHGFFFRRFLEHGGHVLLCLADVLAHQVAGLLDDERLAQVLGDVLAQSGLAGAGRTVEAQRAVAAGFQRLDDTRDLEAAFDVEHVEVVGGDLAPPLLGLRVVGLAAQGSVGILQLPLDQRLERFAACHRLGVRQVGKTHRRANLGGRQALALGQLGDEGVAHAHAFQRLADELFACTGRGRLQLQVIGKAAPEGRVDLLDAVGDPDGGHRVVFQNLVDPRLAVDAVADGCGHGLLLGARHQARRIDADGRENVFHLVKQQRGLLRSFQKDLRNLHRAVAVAARQAVAVAVGVFDLEQIEPRFGRHHLGQFGLAGAGRAVHQHVDALRLGGLRLAQQVDEHLHVVANKLEVAAFQLALGGRAREDGHQLGTVAVFAHQHRRQLFADLHQVGQVGDAVLGDQVFDQADALQPAAGAQGLAHLGGGHAGDGGNRLIRFGRVVDLELDQDAAQVALVARQGAIQQQRTLCLVELQQIR